MDASTNGDERLTVRELTDLAAAALATDHDVDRVVRTLLDRDPSPIQAIKALRASAGMGLGEAKLIVDRNLPREAQEANDCLRVAAWESDPEL